jgi:hypothetical protein
MTPKQGQQIYNQLQHAADTALTAIERPEKVLKCAFHIWSSILSAPMAKKPKWVQNVVEPISEITGVATSAAGDLVPQGRWARTNITEQAFDKFLVKYSGKQNAQKPGWRPFASTMLEAYWGFFGRGIALAHRFLHPPKINSTSHTIVHFAFDDKGSKHETGNVKSIALGNITEIIDPPNDRGATFKKFFSPLLELTSVLNDDINSEEVIETAQEVIEKATENCFRHTLALRGEQARVVLLKEDMLGLRSVLIDELAPQEIGDKTHSQDAQALRAIWCLQLLCLYRELAGSHLYVFYPYSIANAGCKLVFTAWSRSRLCMDRIHELVDLYQTTYDAASRILRNSQEPASDIQKQGQLLTALLGQSVRDAFMLKMDLFRFKHDERARETYWHLPEFLVLAERLAVRAIHEGSPLSFRFHISHGDEASERVKFISRLKDCYMCRDSSCAEALRWEVTRSDVVESLSEEHITSPSIISLLLGNHSFFQDKSTVIQTSPEGYLLYLGRIIGPSEPEHLTSGGKNILLVIEQNGDIKVYYPDQTEKKPAHPNGRLLLWRKAGKWIVPGRYGESYTSAVIARIVQELAYSQEEEKKVKEGMKILMGTVWKLSTQLHKGACFIVLDKDRFEEDDPPKGGRCWDKFFAKMTEVLPVAEGRRLLTKAGQDMLVQLALQDGATIIDLADQRVFGRRHILVPNRVASWLDEKKSQPPKDGRGFLDSEGNHRILAWGTRHQSALAAALCLGKQGKKNSCAGVVITVSSDGDIHVFGPDGMIADLAYPHAAQSTSTSEK